MIKSIMRWILAFVASTVAVILIAPLTAAASLGGPDVAAHTYDSYGNSALDDVTATERGLPPPAWDRHTTYDAVSPGAHGALSRPDGRTTSAIHTHDDTDLLAQIARGSAHSAQVSEVPTDGLGVRQRSSVAANAGVRTCLNSFTGTTLVLMADGTRKPIKDVKLGDWLMATDPVTGETGPRKVIDLIRHGGLHTMVAVRLSDGTTIDATDRHPFWVENRGSWVDAIDLQPGDVVVTADGDRLTVESLGISEQDLTAYNLTVDGLHTYFVGAEDVLVHNAAGPTGLRGASDGLTSVFGGGSVRGRSIADIRSGLFDDGFTQGLANNKKGYLFTNSAGEQVRIMSRGGGWDIRIRNAAGNYLDEFGNVAAPGSTHSIEVFSR